jgi:hypothetical protein
LFPLGGGALLYLSPHAFLPFPDLVGLADFSELLK